MEKQQIQLMIYQHMMQLTIAGEGVTAAFAIAHETAAIAFEEDWYERGALAAREALERLMSKREARDENAKGLDNTKKDMP